MSNHKSIDMGNWSTGNPADTVAQAIAHSCRVTRAMSFSGSSGIGDVGVKGNLVIFKYSGYGVCVLEVAAGGKVKLTCEKGIGDFRRAQADYIKGIVQRGASFVPLYRGKPEAAARKPDLEVYLGRLGY